MAIYGCGATYNGEDMSSSFIEEGCICVGYTNTQAPAIFEILRRAKIGDIIYLKSFTPRGSQLKIKAVGIFDCVEEENNLNSLIEYPNLGFGRKVKWFTPSEPVVISLSEREFTYNVYNNTLYEEYSETIMQDVLRILFSGLDGVG